MTMFAGSIESSAASDPLRGLLRLFGPWLAIVLAHSPQLLVRFA